MKEKGVDIDNKFNGYMIAPLDLTEKQMLIYQKMYTKCNFQDMTVKYTLEQLANDIRIIDIPTKTIYKNIKSMINKGYIELIKKASKGNAPIYRILKMDEILGEPKVNQGRTKGEPKYSNINELNSIEENQKRTKGEPKGYPIKEKEKENNIYSDFERIILKKYPGRKIKSTRDKKVPKLLKEYSVEELTRCIERYSNECKGKNKQYILNESTFWNGRYIDYLDSNYTNDEEVKPIKNNITNWD